jgi:hypothetical protein
LMKRRKITVPTAPAKKIYKKVFKTHLTVSIIFF